MDPWLKSTRQYVFDLIENASSVVDVCCGTGALVFKLASKCRQVVGIDLSKKMINQAHKRQDKNRLLNVEFFHADATQLSKVLDQQFDYATVVFGLHEMLNADRVQVLNEMRAVGMKIIIADFTAPKPNHPNAIMNSIIEVLAGWDHFRNSRNFLSSGGIEGLLETCELTTEKVLHDRSGTTTIVKVH